MAKNIEEKGGEGYMSIHDILAANGINQRMLVESLEREDEITKKETIDDIEADIKANYLKTDLSKERFISEMKNTLGKDMMKNPSAIKIIKKPWYKKLSNFFKDLFTKF